MNTAAVIGCIVTAAIILAIRGDIFSAEKSA